MNRTRRPRRGGCGLLLLSCLVTCGLLLANRVLVTSLYLIMVPPQFDYAQLRTVVQFVFMVVLLLPEWWLIDRLRQWTRVLIGSAPRPD